MQGWTKSSEMMYCTVMDLRRGQITPIWRKLRAEELHVGFSPILYWVIGYLTTLFQQQRLYNFEWDDNAFRVGNGLKGDCRRLFRGTVPTLTWRDWGKSRQTLLVRIPADIRAVYLRNACLHHPGRGSTWWWSNRNKRSRCVGQETWQNIPKVDTKIPCKVNTDNN
jgi:hypothetical protein